MKENSLTDWQTSSYLSGANADYVETLYEQFLKNPQAVAPEWQQFFASLSDGQATLSHADIRADFQKIFSVGGGVPRRGTATAAAGQSTHGLQVSRLIDAFRRYGHFQAQLDPLQYAAMQPRPELELKYYGLDTVAATAQFKFDAAAAPATLAAIQQHFKSIYCSTIGFEYQHITQLEQVNWLRERIEAPRPKLTAATQQQILRSLTRAEGLEKYLAAKYVGQTRFSLEGGESLMPLLDAVIEQAGAHQVKEIVMGMGHRGRLNVLINTFGMPIADLCLAFEGKAEEPGSGDVKYHLGRSADIKTEQGDNPIHLSLAFNPSHLEIINPVVAGSARARQQRRQGQERSHVLPIVMHGDAAFAGQGVVMETLAFSQTRGFGTAGTLHIVTNNQVGFTINNPQDARSSWYCSDIAKMIEAPIFHVNADDPEAVYWVGQLALDFRMRFQKDVVIDLVCYRRYGHNEGDEPAATQPRMYQLIKQHTTVRQRYAEYLVAQQIIAAERAAQLVTDYRTQLDQEQPIIELVSNEDPHLVNWQPYLHTAVANVDTTVELDRLKTLAAQIEKLPGGFVLQAQVAKMMDDRRKMTAGELPLNWGYAETLAYASLLSTGHSIRMSGEDCQRGTFAHRHAVLHDQTNEAVYTPLETVLDKDATFTIVDSLLSEEAVLGFEYGYAASSPESLVIWEAQYGDFVNGAQVVIDQFINSGEQKWGRLSAVTLYLPHGYEGAGPEHSSARLERFLQLCAQDNMQVCVPSTPAQMFHMIRRQVLQSLRKPLIVFMPKSLLRHKLATASLEDLARGQFERVLRETELHNAANITRVLICSGKIYYDLLEQRRARKLQHIAIVRVEQLYPYPSAEITQVFANYKKAKDVFWCQEEPQNQGAWYATVHQLTACLGKGQTLRYVGREAAASTATGSKYTHARELKDLMDAALN